MGGPLPRRSAPQAASALHVARRAGAPPAHPRRGRGRARPRHPVLEHATSSSRRRTTRPSSPGTRTRPTGGSTRRTSSPPGWRFTAEQPRATAHAGHPGHATSSTRCRTATHSTDEQPALARPGDRGRGRRARRCDSNLQPGRDVAAPRAARARLARRTRRTTGASASRSATSRPACARSPARTARRWCAATTATVISSSSRGPRADMDPAMVRCTSRSPSATRRSSIAAPA